MGKRGVGFYWKLAFTNLKGNRRVYLPTCSPAWGSL